MIINEVMKITKSGQVTIPKFIRDKLNTDTIIFQIVGEEIHIAPVSNVAGALKEFAVNTEETFSNIRKAAWKEQSKRHSKDV